MNDSKSYLHVELGADGNPEIKAFGSEDDQKLLCIALMAGLTKMYGADDIARYLMGLVMCAADLLERMEETNNA